MREIAAAALLLFLYGCANEAFMQELASGLGGAGRAISAGASARQPTPEPLGVSQIRPF